jgi:lipopolysaccharide biosynthesis glycosyltransferase
LTENFKAEDQQIITHFFAEFSNVSFDFIPVEEKLKLLEGAALCAFKSHIPYARFFIAELLPSISKCIYLDVDIIVNCNIRELWNIGFRHNGEEFALAACIDSYDIETSRIHLNPEHLYFNSGVLIINCDRWRNERIGRNLAILTKHIQNVKYVDQDILNVYFDDNQYISLPADYNYLSMHKYKEHVEPKIIHYTRGKPWMHSDFPLAEKFWNYAEKTPYYQLLRERLKQNLKTNKYFIYLKPSELAPLLRKQIKK